MRGIYVIAIAILACWTEVTAKEYQPEQSIPKEPEQSIPKEQDYIPIKCPFPEDDKTTNIAHESDCTKFYKCNFGKGVLQYCPLMNVGDPHTRLHFNRREQVCDWPSRAGCEHCPLKEKGYWPRSKISHETNCRMYYLCINGKKYLQHCPPGTCFSRTCQGCVRNWAGGNCNY
ncbi:PREDICTED: peritrophin-1-like [Vollenhovia emeryi]|uniref:peritrophin-1-like n=1 Tax=Vollenhovia emeryi TaxID=411798 RepID=UPI0005F4CD70|nr:PREDICTED: peritrophin-1-like [Vollenhovia emeryi]